MMREKTGLLSSVAQLMYSSAVHRSTQASPFSMAYIEPPEDLPELPKVKQGPQGL